jgi:hypothetical protein
MRTLALLTCSVLAMAPLLFAGDARACGGMFCDAGPTPMPVNQTGENILFVVDGTSVEAHIQIQYEGAASRFAWVIPVQSLPEFAVGSGLLFDRLLPSTAPTYRFTDQNDCFNGTAGSGGSASGGTSSSTGGSGGGPPQPAVVYKATVGAFDITVLESGDPGEVALWLAANGYLAAPSAQPIVEEYVNRKYLFAALKLTGGAGIDEIHPLVLRYTSGVPCVPLKLTGVAAVENMGVRTFFLADQRAVPSNFRHVVLDPLKLEWLAGASNYAEAVTQAVDGPGANGHAFVTEYGGSSAVVPQAGIYDPKWDDAVFVSAPVTGVISVLQAQGLLYCDGSQSCRYNHPLLAPLLHEHIPVPANVSEGAFYGCLDCYADQIDAAAWDGPLFAAKVKERIIDPGKHAVALLAQWPYLTRLYTTISPAEMTEDPEFHLRAGLPDVASDHMGTRHLGCGCDSMMLPGGRTVSLPTSWAWPDFPAAPWAERVEEIPLEADVVVLTDNGPTIEKLLQEHNAGACTSGGAGGSAGASGLAGTSGSAGAPGTAGATGVDGGAAGATGEVAGSGGGQAATSEGGAPGAAGNSTAATGAGGQPSSTGGNPRTGGRSAADGATAPAEDGGCSATGGGANAELSLLPLLGLVIAAERRRRRKARPT